MNSTQRRQARRAWLRRYPYTIGYDSIKDRHSARAWCNENIDYDLWTTSGYSPFKGVRNLEISQGFRFTNHKDAVYFSLLWVGS